VTSRRSPAGAGPLAVSPTGSHGSRLFDPGPVVAANRWPTNGHLIADVAELGYLDGTVLDATHGRGTFWTIWQPERLITNDFNPTLSADHHQDYRAFDFLDGSFDATVYDPPYKLNGTPTNDAMDDRYGTGGEKYVPTRVRMENILDGARECYRVTRGFLLVKCEDQVVSGDVCWQTDLITRAVEDTGGRKVEEFYFLNTPRPQPSGRSQRHASRNLSTLLVFARA
jgi:hypothetical protein